ncbi:hypothetical protein K2173_012221 [Erythroxylum novogranatense]|uniref:Uncharacterized protein n=1 Tax=Erythroxylum novogranatense TaxID=1862640 RepID=A0AAV8T8U3_9ROSI|nr:hypothetical protein K2173_012221 [Erythroxylum novogranatense]
MSTEKQKKSATPQIVQLNKAFKLAEQWVKNMSHGVEDEDTKLEPEGRHSRLGLGAKALRQMQVASNDPVERKLRAKLEAEKRKAAQNTESNPSAGDINNSDDNCSDDDLESRTSVFVKKRAGPFAPPSVAVKKKRK